jgi:hypothetical protein
MRCFACKRPIGSATVAVKTKDGSKAWGPKCAKRAGLLQATQRAVKAVEQPEEVDPRQMKLEL